MRLIRTIYLAVTVMVLCIPQTSFAGVGDLFDLAANWWGTHSAGLQVNLQSDETPTQPSDDEEPPSDEPLDEPSDEPSEEPEPDGEGGGETRRVRGMCVLTQEPPITVCEIGSGFLCLNSPAGGVASDSTDIRGTIDRRGSVMASIRVAVQNEYTKKTVFVDTNNITEASDCWSGAALKDSFCLDGDGRFNVTVPLSEPGSYSVSVTASRISGESVEKRVRLSRVVPLEFARADVEFSPNVTEMTSTDESHVMVTANLLGECSFCDFIGASTGGVKITVENTIKDADGSIRHIKCATTVEQGGQGRYVVGVPVENGTNRISITACNEAVKGNCPRIDGIDFIGRGGVGNLVTSSPPPQPSYDSREWPTIPWAFTLGPIASCVHLQLNREAPQEICPDGQGNFSVELKPKTGINVATISLDGHTENYAWSFGWGEIVSPFASGNGAITVPVAAQLAIPAKTVSGVIIPLANNFLAADEFDSLLSGLLDGMMGDDSSESDSVSTPVNIPMCGGGGSLGGFGYSVRGEPKIGGVQLKYVEFGENELDLSLILDNTQVGLDLYPDANGDGNPDKAPLPLIIDIRKAKIDVKLRLEGEGADTLILLDSPHNDCDFKRGSYCQHRPASLIPKNLAGGAYSYGGFIKCDMSKAKAEAKRACRAINTLDAQTGVVSEKVLDAINDAIYCSGSSMLTGLLQDGVTIPDIELGCADGEECEDFISNIFPNVRIPLALLLDDFLKISSEGMLINVGVGVGREDVYSKTPSEYRIENAGLVMGESAGEGPLENPKASGQQLEVAVSLDALNAALFVATVQGDGRDNRGLLDFDIHERFFRAMGFDFVEECDKFEPIPGEKEELPTLCHIRPRVGELLGSSLTSYGYFDSKQPILLAIRGNRALAPRLEVASIEDLSVVERGGDGNPALDGGGEDATEPTGELLALEIGGLELSFYDVELDESQGYDDYGNPAVKYDSNGDAIIKTMRPDEPDARDGPIISFDLTILLGIEVGISEAIAEDESGYVISIRTLSDRSRLVITGMEGSNSTTVPDAGLISALNEKLALAIAGMTPPDQAITFPIPSEIALEADENGEFALFGLKAIGFSKDGLGIVTDPKTNFIRVAVSAIITQLLHQNENVVEYSIPSND
jgi:hypothetical protein